MTSSTSNTLWVCTLTVENVEKASKACKAIAMWTHAMFKFYNVSLLVEPLRKKSAEAKEQLDVQMAALKEAKDRFSEVTRRIDSLTQRYGEWLGMGKVGHDLVC